MKNSTVVIRKYENRRLYDTSASRYVNLDEVAAMIRAGADVEVIDAKTGEDLTRLVLTQIIMEDAKGRPAGLPLELLRQLIIASDHARQEFIGWYLKTAFDAYHKVQESVQSGLSNVGAAALAPLETVRSFLSPGQKERDEEIAQLRGRIAELEARLQSQDGSRRARAKTTRPRTTRATP